MIAIVFSGGGSRGALQAGALRALLERGVQPGLVVGTSVGGINAAYYAVNPSPTRVEKLAHVWRSTRRVDVYPGNRLHVAWRLLRGHGSFYPNDALRRHLTRHFIPDAHYFSDLRLPCYITATNLDTGAMRVLGERRSDKIVDALLATTALPPLHPPYRLDDGDYVDGGAVALLPIEVALARGAKQVYALHIIDGPTPPVGRRTVLQVGGKAISALVQRQWQDSVARCAASRVRLHHIQLTPPAACRVSDYSQTETLLQAGYEQTLAYLDRTLTTAPWHARVWQRATLSCH
jgi:NTE family protein